jgi:hypothetical protein
MKLATCLIGAVLAMASLTACGDDGGDEAGSGSDESSQESTETPDETTDEPTEEPTEEPTDDSGGGGDYCDALRSAKDKLDDFEGDDADIGQFDEVVVELRGIGAEAPSEVADDWEVLLGGFDKLQQALDDAGLTLEDLADPKAMNELDPQVLQQLTDELESLDSKQFEQAGNDIARHAKAECGFKLDDS